MAAADFSQIKTWVFDLDNTLYPPEMRLFDQIEVKMTAWIMDVLDVDHKQANHLRHHYWQTYGTTLAGLMAEHGVDPGPYLIEVHDISFDVLSPDTLLRDRISELPGRRIIYTNGSKPYAENVLNARGLDGLFDAIYGVEHAEFRPKPDYAAFEAVFAVDGLNTKTAAMFEDEQRNLAAPHQMGMKTIHVAPEPHPADHIHHHTDDLSGFLKQLVD